MAAAPVSRRSLALCAALALGGSAAAAPPAPPPTPSEAPITIERDAARALLGRPDRLAGELWLAHPGAEAMKARARGEAVDGPPPPAGLELRGIRPGSHVHRLGLRAGDVLQRLDGTAIDGLPTLIAVALRLRARLADGAGWGFTVDLVRDGQPRTLRYTVTAPDAVSAPPKTAPPEAPAAPPKEIP